MVFQRIISRVSRRSRIYGQAPTLCPPIPVKFSDQLPKPLFRITQKRDLFSGIENYRGQIHVRHNAMPRFLGNLGLKFGFAQENSLPCSLNFANSIHSVGPKAFERGMGNRPVDTEQNFGSFEGSNQRSDDMDRRQPPTDTRQNIGSFESFNRRLADMDSTRAPIETGHDGRPFGRPTDLGQNGGGFESFTRRLADMDRARAPIETGRDGTPFGRPADIGQNAGGFGSFARRLADMDRTRGLVETGRDGGRPFGRDSGRPVNFFRGPMRENEKYRSGTEQNADIVHIKIMRNNTFVTVTDSKGNKKMGASAGCLAEMKGGPKVSKYSAEATAEHVGRVAKSMGLKSVVMKVNGFTFFKKKKLAILSFRDGYTNSRPDRNPIVYIEDTTRKPHNGCRLKKQRRV